RCFHVTGDQTCALPIFEKYGKNNRLTMALIIEGVSFEDQNKKLDRGVDVLIATHGRLLDQFDRGKILLTGVEILVIDEADRMLRSEARRVAKESTFRSA